MISFLAARAVPGIELVDRGAYSHVTDIDGGIQMTQARDEDALIAGCGSPSFIACLQMSRD
jgi:hypothetical protein